jgi:hypothetical protein
VAINPDLVDYIRTMVRGDHEANERIEQRLDARGWDGFPALFSAVFHVAVRRRFPSGAAPDEIIRFVAEMRCTAPVGAPEIDANAAEKMIHAAVDPTLVAEVDPQTAGRVEGLTILYVLGGEEISDADLDALLLRAVERTSRA